MFGEENPFGCESVASIGGVAAAADPEGLPEPAFQTGPKTQAFEDGVEEFGDHTVVSGLGIRVVDRMVSGTLQDPQIMEKVYPRAVVAEVGVFDLMEYADDKIGGEDSQGRGSEGFADAECPRNDLIHDPAFVAVCWKVA